MARKYHVTPLINSHVIQVFDDGILFLGLTPEEALKLGSDLIHEACDLILYHRQPEVPKNEQDLALREISQRIKEKAPQRTEART